MRAPSSPLIIFGGADAETDLNLPIAGVAALLVVLFLRVPTPQGTLKSKLSNLDWMCVPSLAPLRPRSCLSAFGV